MNGNGIGKKSIATFISIAGAIYIPIQSIPILINYFKWSPLQILFGWGILYLLILSLYSYYYRYKGNKDYFAYARKVIDFILLVILTPIIYATSFIFYAIKGLYYLQYLEEIFKKTKPKIVRRESKMKSLIKRRFKGLFDVPIWKSLKQNKKGQILFIALLVALIVLIIIIVFLFIKGG